MVSGRRKRKAAEAALDAIVRVQEQEAAIDDDGAVTDEDDGQNGGNDDDEDLLLEPVLCCDGSITLPKELFVDILEFLSKPDLVHRASLVSSAWLAASKSPLLWLELKEDVWKSYPLRKRGRAEGVPAKTVFSSIRHFYEFLRRPQFARLKALTPPDLYRTMHRNVFDRIAEACPQLEDLDLSACATQRLNAVVPHDEELLRLPALFPKLNRLRLCMRHATRENLARFAQLMGERLVELHVFVGPGGERVSQFCSDDTLEAIGQHCSNLESFRYVLREGCWFVNLITKRGVFALVRGCPKLRHLNLITTRDVCREVDRFVLERWHSPLSCILRYLVDISSDSDSDSD
jgi:hypothetical protein